MACPICDQKPINCDCTAEERRQYAEIEDLEGEVDRLRAERQWIPVSERLPDDGQQVLIAQRLPGWTDEMPTRTQSSWYEHEEFCGEGDDIPHQCVTHWMPMPEPPGQDATYSG